MRAVIVYSFYILNAAQKRSEFKRKASRTSQKKSECIFFLTKMCEVLDVTVGNLNRMFMRMVLDCALFFFSFLKIFTCEIESQQINFSRVNLLTKHMNQSHMEMHSQQSNRN